MGHSDRGVFHGQGREKPSRLYRSEDGVLREVCHPRAVSVEDLCGGLNEKTLFVGDGVKPYREKITELLGENELFAPANLCFLL